MQLTVHIDALLLAEGGAELLDLGGEGALHVLRRTPLMCGGRDRWKRVGRLGGGGGDGLDESMTTAEVLEEGVGPLVSVGPRSGEWSGRAVRTRVMSDVSCSISRSSADRSENPGRTCLACSLSSVATTSERGRCRRAHGRDGGAVQVAR